MELFGLAGGALIVFLILAALSAVVWVWALIDCALNPSLSTGQKLVWLLVIFFTEIIGAVVYLLVRPKGTAGGGTLDRPL